MTDKTETQAAASKGIFISPDKPLDLGSVDSDLFSAILSGEVEFVRSRFRGNDRMSDAEAILMIRTRRAEEEKVYAKHVAAEHYQQEQEDPSKKVGAAFFGGMTYDAYMRNQSRPADGNTRQGIPEADLFGGYYMSGRYFDAYGGAYDQHGYQFANGNYKTAAGDLFDMAKGVITLLDGREIKLAPEVAKDGRAVLIMEKSVMDIAIDEFDQIQAKIAAGLSTTSLEGKLLNTGDDAKPSANALEVGAPTATATSGGIAAAAMHVAAPAAAAAVAGIPSTTDMNAAFANDEAFRAAASYEEGGGLSRMKKDRPASEVGLRMAAKFIFENKVNGHTGDEMCHLHKHQEHRVRQAVRDSVKSHSKNMVEKLNVHDQITQASTALSSARAGFYNGTEDSVKAIIGNVMGDNKAGSIPFNLGKKPEFKL
ncbi:MAG: hypothetical protein PSY14_00225 [bacterium]|nr:hypothetical protein [bacterium]